MTATTYNHMSDTTQTGITPVMPCTLMIYADGAGGWAAQRPGSGVYGEVRVEVKKGNGTYQKFDDLTWRDDTVQVIDLPGATIRVVADNVGDVSAYLMDSAPAEATA